MKTYTYKILMFLWVLLGFSCEQESLEDIVTPTFYVNIPESAPVTAYPNKVLSFPVEVHAESGLEKVEVRMDFQSIDGTTVNSFETSTTGIYDFSYTPSSAELGQNLEFVIVAYDKNGYTYDANYSVEIVLEPVIIEMTLPEVLPDTLETGETIDFDINITSEIALESVETIYNDTTISALTVTEFENSFITTYSFTYLLAPVDGGKDVTFTFRATDEEQKFKEVTYTLYVKGVRLPQPLDTHADVTLGMQSNATAGPFLDVEANAIYTVAAAKSNSSSVDLGVFRSGSSGINLFAPIYSNAAQFIYNQANWGDDWLGNWTVRNTTEVRTIASELMSESDFNSMTDDELLLEVFEQSEPSVENLNQIAAGDLIAFKTVDGKHGALLVKSIVAASNGSITFDYKIQQ